MKFKSIHQQLHLFDLKICLIYHKLQSSLACALSITEPGPNFRERYVLYLFTEYVFDGKKGDYTESYNTILQTQKAGVRQERVTHSEYTPKNLSQEYESNALTDRITFPTHALNLGEMMHEVIDKNVKWVIHLSGSSQISRFKQAVEIVSAYDLDEDVIKPTSINEMKWKARRPNDSSLNTTKAYDTPKNQWNSKKSSFAISRRVRLIICSPAIRKR